jgi:hypothetical protein
MNDTPPFSPDPHPPNRESDRLWVIACHLSGLALFTAIPFGQIIAPLVIWLIKKDEIPAVDYHGKEALNFQISMTIYMIVAALSIFVAVGIVLLPIVVLIDLILIIVAAVKASGGEAYRYPFTIRFVA